jgi:hypothetical protein
MDAFSSISEKGGDRATPSFLNSDQQTATTTSDNCESANTSRAFTSFEMRIESSTAAESAEVESNSTVEAFLKSSTSNPHPYVDFPDADVVLIRGPTDYPYIGEDTEISRSQGSCYELTKRQLADILFYFQNLLGVQSVRD